MKSSQTYKQNHEKITNNRIVIQSLQINVSFNCPMTSYPIHSSCLESLHFPIVNVPLLIFTLLAINRSV